MRLIDADRLKAEIMGWSVVTGDLFGMGKYHEREIVLQAIEESPTINAAPVVRGEWVAFDTLNTERPYNWICSSCGYGCVDYRTAYCHDCGAKMEGKQDE